MHFEHKIHVSAKKALSNMADLDPLFATLTSILGAQWLSGRVLDSRPRGRGFESRWVVVLERDTFILA